VFVHFSSIVNQILLRQQKVSEHLLF